MPFIQSPADAHAPPAAFVQARSAVAGLGALFNVADPRAMASLAAPASRDIASLLFVVGGKLDEGLADMGFDMPDRSSPPAL